MPLVLAVCICYAFACDKKITSIFPQAVELCYNEYKPEIDEAMQQAGGIPAMEERKLIYTFNTMD